MRANDLLECIVVDTNGKQLGRVRDIHVVQDGPLRASGQAALRVHGLVAGRFAFATRLGYLTMEGIPSARETRGPLPIRALVRWLHRDAIYIPWLAIIQIERGTILVTKRHGPTE